MQTKCKSEDALLREMRKSAARVERDKWMAVASRHYDLTGRRISPEMAKKMIEG